MKKDRDQLTPAEAKDREHLRTHRGQGTAASGLDRLPNDTQPPTDEIRRTGSQTRRRKR